MRTILFDYPDSKLEGRLYALNMRVGYLLSNTVMCMGPNLNAYSLINDVPRYTTRQKLVIMSSDGNVGDQIKELDKNIRSLQKQVKYQNGRMIIASKKIESSINRYFIEYMEWLSGCFYSKGFPAVEEFEENKVFQMANLSQEPERNDGHNSPLSEWFQLTQEEECESDMVMMPANFMDHPAIKEYYREESDPLATDINTIYFKHCLTLPKISSLTILEMNSIRKAIAPVLESFTASVNNWIDLFWNEDGGELVTTEFFNNTILQATENLQAAYDSNLILKHLVRTTSPADQVEVFIGEVPVKLIWRYFKDNKIIPNETWQKLKKAVLRDDRLTKRWPVITVRCNDIMWSQPVMETATAHTNETVGEPA